MYYVLYLQPVQLFKLNDLLILQFILWNTEIKCLNYDSNSETQRKIWTDSEYFIIYSIYYQVIRIWRNVCAQRDKLQS